MAKVVSIEVGYSNIKLCEIDYKAKTPRVYRFAMVPTPPNAIEDGYLKESAGLRTAIKEALFRNRIKAKRAIFTVTSSKIINREVTLPPVKPNMMESMIKANLGEYFPIDLSDHEVSHVVLETFKDGDNAGKTRVMLVAVEKALVASYEALSQACGLTLVDLDFVGNSIYQAVKKEASKVPSMVLKIEENQTLITVVKDNNMMLQRSINYGIEEAVHEVAASPAFEVLDDKEAWQLVKRRCCIKVALDNDTNIIEPDLEQDDDAETTQARINVTRTLLPLISGVSRVVDFYNSRNPEHIAQAYIIGKGGDMSGLAKLLTNELGIKTNVFQKLEGIVWHPSMGEGDLFNYVAAIGASMAPVSVISSEKKQKMQKETNSKSLAVLLGVFFVLASAALAANGYLMYQSQLEEQKRLQGLETTYLPAEQIYQRYVAMSNMYQEILMGHLMTNRPNDNVLNFLGELETKLPTDVTVMEFTSDDEQAVLLIRAADKDTAAGIIQNLRDFASLQYVSVDSIREVEEEIQGEEETEGEVDPEDIQYRRYVEFSVVCSYYPNGYLPEQEPDPQSIVQEQLGVEAPQPETQQTEGQVE
ncbi:MAG: pilus assembly protein PilM [Acetatifactor sp.]|nr:pilus assembly protein PilM [Acetatifactor sp.]